MMAKHFGKYRGTVFNNIDPMLQARVQVSVPALGVERSWAMPCLPFAGNNAGFHAVPSIGSNVWIEFERGEIDHPIWVGGFWDQQNMSPVTPVGPHSAVTLRTPGGNSLTIDDTPAKGISLSTITGAHLTINEAGITISNGKGASITMVGPSIVLNQGAFEVT